MLSKLTFTISNLQPGVGSVDWQIRHSLLRVCENNICKLLWNFAIVTDTSSQHNHPDITMLLKETIDVYLIDIAILGNSRLSQKAVEKQTK